MLARAAVAGLDRATMTARKSGLTSSLARVVQGAIGGLPGAQQYSVLLDQGIPPFPGKSTRNEPAADR